MVVRNIEIPLDRAPARQTDAEYPFGDNPRSPARAPVPSGV